MPNPRIVIGATHSGTGKTTITSGLILSLRSRSLSVQPFKVGPDYIDPGFHTLAAGRECRNLDTVMMGEDGVAASFLTASEDADISIIEGVMGLYDGFTGGEGSAPFFGSTAQIAKVLAAPVVLCIDASAMAASAAAVALGFQLIDREVPLAGFILNNVAGPRHFEMIKGPVEDATGLTVFGSLPRNKQLSLPERHLGLVPAWEGGTLPESFKLLENSVSQHIDIDALIETARNASESAPKNKLNHTFFPFGKKSSKTGKTKIGYALDDAFHFYYRDNLDILEGLGAELIPFSPLRDDGLPNGIGGIYLGGGYPEMYGKELEENGGMRAALKKAAGDGLPIYAECGGLMYLMDRIVDFDGSEYAMCGVFTGEVRMEKKLAALGYYRGTAEVTTILAEAGDALWGHVFHWSTLAGTDPEQQYGFVLEKDGSEAIRDGLMFRNTLAGYFHVHFAGNPAWAKRFVDICHEAATV